MDTSFMRYINVFSQSFYTSKHFEWSISTSKNIRPRYEHVEMYIGNPKTRKTLRLLSSGTKLFITFELKVFRHEERETQSFYADCFYIVSSQPNQRAAPVAHEVVWPRPGLNLDSLVRRQELNSLLFLKSPKSSAHASGAWRQSHPLVIIPIWDFYFDISEWHILSTRAVNTCAHVCT